MHVLLTGAAGFIGFHLCTKLLELGHTVVGLDNLNDYYSPQLKADRLQQLVGQPGFEFVRQDLADAAALMDLFAQHKFTHVVNLAAQAGVRYSLENPAAYVKANLTGFAGLLEACRAHPVEHLVFASSSSVYGLNTSQPLSEHSPVDHPVSLYAATKKSNEMMAHAYSHLFRLPCTGLRFFSVYGPWGRPDMALFYFTRNILAGKPIDIYNNGKMLRDFTYIDDIVSGVVACLLSPAKPNPAWDSANPDSATSSAPYRIYNIGNNHPEELEHFIAVLEKTLNKTAIRNLLPMQPGDVPATFANIDDLHALAGFTPKTGIEEGIPRFVEWYRQYHNI